MSINSPFSSVQSLSRVQRFTTPWTAACQASLSITNSRGPLALVLNLLWQRAMRQQHFFLPNSGSLGSNHSLRESCSWIVNSRNVPEETPRLASPDFFPVTQHPQTHPNSHSACGGVLSSVGGVTLRKEAGAGNPTPRKHGAQGSVQSSSIPEAQPSFVCWRLDSSVGGPGRSSAGTPGPRRAPWLAHVLQLPHPQTLQPWDCSLLRLQACDTSRDHQGLRDIESAFLFSFSFFNFNISWLYQFSSVTQSCPTLCDPMDCSMPGFPVRHQFSLLKLMFIESVIPSNHLILCHPLLLPPSTFPSIRVFSNESVLHIRWPKYWSFSISPSSEYSGLISFRIDWLDLLAVQGTLKSLLQHHSSKASILWCSAFFMVQFSHPYMTTGKTIALTRQNFVGKWVYRPFRILWGIGVGFC